MRTADAVTPAKGIWFVFAFTMAIYLGLAVVSIVVLRGLSRRWREDRIAAGEIPYGPPPAEPASGPAS
jgi:hypothetical protein